MRAVLHVPLGIILLATAVSAGAQDATPPPEPGIVIAGIGKTDPKLLDRVRAHVEKYNSCPTRTISISGKLTGDSLEKQQELLGSHLQEEDVALIALVDLPEVMSIREDFGRVPRVAILNTAKLRPQSPRVGEGQEAYARRVEKETMRLIALTLGLKPCPWPRCALHTPPAGARYEAVGRNLCPPCERSAQKILETKGITLLINRRPPVPPEAGGKGSNTPKPQAAK